jgi:hypothetical protein
MTAHMKQNRIDAVKEWLASGQPIDLVPQRLDLPPELVDRIVIYLAGLKRCRTCKVVKPLAAFSGKLDTVDGRMSS